MTCDHDTIAAPATAAGGALAVLRVSGSDALAVCDRIFRGRRPLAEAEGYTVHYGHIADGIRTLDDVLVTVFRAPRSYTGEDAAEISCHGSQYIVSEILRLLVAAGARMAAPGEFTIRAYLAGKLDLSQAEAVADLIASSSRAAHALAANQMRGGYSDALEALRERLLHLTSLLELELDFSEEEVEFADRTQLRDTMRQIQAQVDALRSSFSLGNAIKEGVAVAIAGAPNVGKSTLLNRLLNEDRAMVSEIAGTTRDVIEERLNIDGVVFRFLDTAGIRTTDDRLERMGIERTMSGIARAQIVLHLVDAAQCAIASGTAVESSTLTVAAQYHDVYVRSQESGTESEDTPESGMPDQQTAPATGIHESRAGIRLQPSIQAADPTTTDRRPLPDFPLRDDQTLLTVYNKTDTTPGLALPEGAVGISARNGEGIDRLRTLLRDAVDTRALYHGDAVVSNSRHYAALTSAADALRQALDGLDNGLPADLLSEDIRQVIRHLGTITGRGAIAPEEVLQTIFSKFCIGK